MFAVDEVEARKYKCLYFTGNGKIQVPKGLIFRIFNHFPIFYF